MQSGPSARALTLACVAGLGVCLAASTASALNGRAPQIFLPVGISGAVYVVSGYLVALRRPANRIGPLLMLIGILPAAFVVARYALPASEVINSPSGVLPAILLAFVLLAFPSGNLPGRAERLTLAVVAVYFAVYSMAAIISLEPLVHGVSRCPPCVPNPVRITDLSVYPNVQVAADLGIVVSAATVSLLCARRWYLARGAARRVLAPVLFGGIVTALGFLATSVAFLTGSGPALTGQILFLLRLLVPIGLAVTFVRVYASRAAIAGAVVQLGASPSMAGLEVALRRSVGDPGLTVARWSPAGEVYLDREGHRIDLDERNAAGSVLLLERDGRPLAAVVHDAALEVDPALVRTVADAVQFAVDTIDLRDQLRASGGDVVGLPRGEVTFLFGDIEGSTELLSSLGGAYAELLAELRAIVRASAERHAGRVVDARADECFLVFADAVDAVAAAQDIQRRMRDAAWPGGVAPQLRIGLHTGTPDLTPDGYVGIDVHRAARVMAAANGGQILASGVTGTAVSGRLPDGVAMSPLGYFSLKGIADPELLGRVDGIGPRIDLPPRVPAAATPAGGTGAK